MPVTHRESGFVFRFVSFDLTEPMHIHVTKDGNQAKFWLEPLRLAHGGKFKPHELKQIERIIQNNLEKMKAKWHEESKKW